MDDDAEHSAFTLGAAYESVGDPSQVLRRLSLKDGYAYVQEELQLPFLNYDVFSQGKYLALLKPPADVCEADSEFELSIVDVSGETLTASAPLVLPVAGGRGWTLNSWLVNSSEPGQIYVFGGPVSQGRAVVDVTTDPPTLLRYESFNWR
jgi:hypothetical protein